MKLMVATDAHIFRTPDGKYWSKNIYEYKFWTRYMNVFEEVRIVARVKDISKKSDKLAALDGPGVEVYGIPFYQGPKQLLMKYVKIQKRLRNVSDGCDAALFRLPSQTAQMALNHTKKNIPIAGEIVYDPFDDLNRPEDSFVLKRPIAIYEVKEQNLDNLIDKINRIIKVFIDNSKVELFKYQNSYVFNNPEIIYKFKKQNLDNIIGKLEVLNTMNTLKRGYAITKKDNHVISSIQKIKKDDNITINLQDGYLETKVIKVGD